jgi:uncharacterized protein YqfB (UPF0267 family)
MNLNAAQENVTLPNLVALLRELYTKL